MCPLMGITFSDEVSVLYFYLIKKMEDWKREEYIEREFPEDGLFEECMKTVDAWMDDEKLSSKISMERNIMQMRDLRKNA